MMSDARSTSLRNEATPFAAVRDAPLRENISRFAGWCSDRGALLMPHVKTTMCRYIVDLQLAAGAAGLTVATVRQAQTVRGWTDRPIFLANQVADPAGLRAVASLSAEGPTLVTQVDSVAGVAMLSDQVMAVGGSPLPVLVELGHAAGRSGVRTERHGLDLGMAVDSHPGLVLCGVTGFEGTMPRETPEQTRRDVDRFLHAQVDLMRAFIERGLLDAADAAGHMLMISAGGSAFFDRVAEAFAVEWPSGLDVRTVLRSGCYVTHDHGVYDRLSPLGSGTADLDHQLRPAVEVWGTVTSTPETNVVVVTVGKRDIGSDSGMPPVIRLPDAPGSPPGTLTVEKLNDQHAVARLAPGARAEVGDRVILGVSHPCTTFDRWRQIFIIDDHDNVLRREPIRL